MTLESIRARWEEWRRPDILHKLIFVLLSGLLYPLLLALVEGPVDLSLIYPNRYLQTGFASFYEEWAACLLFVVIYWAAYFLLWGEFKKTVLLCALSYAGCVCGTYLWSYGFETIVSFLIGPKHKTAGLTLAEHGAVVMISIGWAIALIEEIVPAVTKTRTRR
jgi:hypothetical protein